MKKTPKLLDKNEKSWYNSNGGEEMYNFKSSSLLFGILEDVTEENIPELIALLKRAADEGKYVIVFGS